MQINALTIESPSAKSTCSFGHEKTNVNNEQEKQQNNSSSKYLIGATILATTIAAGLFLHKKLNKNPYKNIDEATKYFKKQFGINPNFNKCEDLEYIRGIDNIMQKLKQLNCKLPTTIDFCSFKYGAIQIAMIKRGLIPRAVSSNARGYAGKNGHVFFNSETLPTANIISIINTRKLGHFNSPTPSNLEVKEYIAAHEAGHINAKATSLKKGFKSEFGELSDDVVDNLLNHIQKHQNEMYLEVKPMTNNVTNSTEIIPEVFAKLILNPKLEFSDKTMLLYDIMGGGAIPNKKIKGKIYSEYMQDLYKRAREIIN